MARFLSIKLSSIVPIALATALLTGGATFASAAFGNASAASAQDAPAPAAGPPAGANRGRMAKVLMSLNLSEAQKSQIRAIRDATMKANANITDRDARRANYTAMRAKVEAVLTPAQRSEFKAKLDALKQQDQNPHS